MSNARLTLRVGHRYRRRLPFRRHKPECEKKVEEMMKDLEKRGDLSNVLLLFDCWKTLLTPIFLLLAINV